VGCSQVCRQMQRRHASHIITTICDTFAFCHIVSRMDWRWRVRLALQRFHLWLGRRRLLGQATSNLQVESNPIKILTHRTPFRLCIPHSRRRLRLQRQQLPALPRRQLVHILRKHLRQGLPSHLHLRQVRRYPFSNCNIVTF
jgi:hypothetical protein